MRAMIKETMINFLKALQNLHISTFINPETFRRALLATAELLESFICESGTDTNCEQSRHDTLRPTRPTRDSRVILPGIEPPEHLWSAAEKNKGAKRRKAFILQPESEHTEHEKRGRFRYSEVQDLRPRHLRNTNSKNIHGLHSNRIKKKKRRGRANERRSAKHPRHRSSSGDIDFDMYYLARRARRKQTCEPLLQDPMLRKALADLESTGRADHLSNSRRCEEPKKIDWDADEGKRTASHKRGRESSTENSSEERKLKLRRMR